MLRRLVLLAALVLTGSTTAAAAQPRIVGGVAASAGAYPAQAEVIVSMGPEVGLCGGTLVAPQWVLTAGHCVSDERFGQTLSAASFTVRLGSTTLDAGTPYSVDAVERAPGYSSATLGYDAALLHLAAAAPDTPLRLITNAESAAAAAGQTARVIGWGTTSEGGDVSTTLQEVDVPLVTDDACAATYGAQFVAATMECAGYATGGKDACQGDSGGPLMVSVGGSWVLDGIVSTGDGCAEPGRYGVYTDLLEPTLHTWFSSTTGLAADTTSAPGATATPTPTPTPVAAVATAPLVARAGLHLARRCSARSCAFAVSFASGGTVTARVTLAASAARRLGRSRVVARSRRAIAAAGTRTLRLRMPASLRRVMGRRGLRRVSARLRVTATPVGGRATRASRTVAIRA